MFLVMKKIKLFRRGFFWSCLELHRNILSDSGKRMEKKLYCVSFAKPLKSNSRLWVCSLSHKVVVCQSVVSVVEPTWEIVLHNSSGTQEIRKCRVGSVQLWMKWEDWSKMWRAVYGELEQERELINTKRYFPMCF